MGGKWTTHRAMGEDTVTRVQESLNVPVTESPTRQHVLYGGEGYTHDYWKKLAQDYQIPELTAHHLARKFGTASEEVLALKAENPALLQPILAGCAPIQAEVVYSVRHEMAATVEDVLARRIGTQLYSWSDAIDAAPVVGSLLAAELGWSSDAARDAVAQYVAKINHLLQSAGLSYKPSKRG
jgi:glycerol-3-phosphate dehydrogenase